MATQTSMMPRLQLGKVVRENFLAELFQAMDEIAAAVQARLDDALDDVGNLRESQTRRDLWMHYKTARSVWVAQVAKAWRERLVPPLERKSTLSAELDGMELVDAGVMETRIIASRLSLAVNEAVHTEFDDLRVRIRVLENTDDLSSRDLLRAEVLIAVLIEQWADVGMATTGWNLVNAAVQFVLTDRFTKAYRNANATLVSRGVLPVIALKDRVKVNVRPSAAAPLGADKPPPPAGGSGASGPGGTSSPGGRGPDGAPTDKWGADKSGSPATSAAGFAGGPSGQPTQAGHAPATGSAPFWRTSSTERHGLSSAEETRMLTSTTPLARARVRAQGVLGQIRRLFTSGVGHDFSGTVRAAPSPALVEAISPQVVSQRYAEGGTLYQDFSPEGVARVADDLRERTVELKKKAESNSEKAIIEIVALMFQAILAEERIPAGIRVWFARLQMPVLRVALEDPDFLGSAEHPARALIDRMGSCVMGFDASGVQGAAMEAEVKRVVQVIEQYPETGKKVYQIVYAEFQKFLSKFLTEKGTSPKVISVAQQVEQKETLAIQYTIEMRNMLKELPVRDEIRDYLFKVWAEVLAVCALRKGAKHADTIAFKACATDLVWAASAKPSRADRTRVIQDLPNLLLRLRAGMALLSMAPSEQEAHIKKISDTLADAFLSKTQAIPQAKIDAMARRLASLEDFVSEDGMGDLPLDSESLEMMLGIDAASIDVISAGGSKPTAPMYAWALELQPGTWYSLDYQHQVIPVQFAWHSERRHLNLFASGSGKTYLLQGGRLAAYLQAGLLVPLEEEALTVRATRDALAKLEADPHMLLS